MERTPTADDPEIKQEEQQLDTEQEADAGQPAGDQGTVVTPLESENEKRINALKAEIRDIRSRQTKGTDYDRDKDYPRLIALEQQVAELEGSEVRTEEERRMHAFLRKKQMELRGEKGKKIELTKEESDLLAKFNRMEENEQKSDPTRGWHSRQERSRGRRT